MVSRVADEWDERERERQRIEKNRWGDGRAEKSRKKAKWEREEWRGKAGDGAARVGGEGGGIRIKIQISQLGKSPHFEVRGAQWANMNTLQRVCIQPRAGNAFY